MGNIREKLGLGPKGKNQEPPKDEFVEDDINKAFPGYGGNVELGASTGHVADRVERETVTTDDVGEANDDYDDTDPHDYSSFQRRQFNPSTLSKLSKNYLAAAIDNFRRIPSASLTETFRAQLLKYRQFLTILTQKGVKGEALLVIGMVQVLATDRMGQIEAVQFLRSLQRQILWNCSVDVARLRKPPKERDEQRDPPLGMRDMSDHSDAIQGVAGPDTNPNSEMTEDDVFSALIDLNGFLSFVADTIPTNVEEREFLKLEHGLAYTDKRVPDPNWPKGERWDPVHNVEEAMDLQLVLNAASMVKRDERNAERRAQQLAQIAKLYS